MYLALREIRFATGRFVLMGGVITLITVLLVMLSGLTAGLGNQSTSAIASLQADTIAFGPPDDEADVSYTDSAITSDQVDQWQNDPEVATAEPLGVSQTNIEADRSMSVAVFGAPPDSDFGPPQVADGQVVISEEIADELAITTGDTAALGGAEVEIAATMDTEWYSHSPLIWTSQSDWQGLANLTDEDTVGTVIAATHGDTASADEVRDSLDAGAATVSMSPTDSFSALAAYQSENASLTMMQAFLYGISALVITAFLTVWTIQRTRDIAVLKALGASDSYVLKDALTQAGIILTAGAVLGGVIGVAGGMLAAEVAPFIIDAATTLIPVLGVIILGLFGSLLAVRRVTKVDPMIALGGN